MKTKYGDYKELKNFNSTDRREMLQESLDSNHDILLDTHGLLVNVFTPNEEDPDNMIHEKVTDNQCIKLYDEQVRCLKKHGMLIIEGETIEDVEGNIYKSDAFYFVDENSKQTLSLERDLKVSLADVLIPVVAKTGPDRGTIEKPKMITLPNDYKPTLRMILLRNVFKVLRDDDSQKWTDGGVKGVVKKERDKLIEDISKLFKGKSEMISDKFKQPKVKQELLTEMLRSGTCSEEISPQQARELLEKVISVSGSCTHISNLLKNKDGTPSCYSDGQHKKGKYLLQVINSVEIDFEDNANAHNAKKLLTADVKKLLKDTDLDNDGVIAAIVYVTILCVRNSGNSYSIKG